jgi:hypothetical protein
LLCGSHERFAALRASLMRSGDVASDTTGKLFRLLAMFAGEFARDLRTELVVLAAHDGNVPYTAEVRS